MRRNRHQFWFSVLWFLITFSMVTWWWIFSLRQLNSLEPYVPAESHKRMYWMLQGEGIMLLVFILGGGIALLTLTNRVSLQNERLRLFFSNFSHDLKTSLSRLRLRAEVLVSGHNQNLIAPLLEEVSRLDLQLENSLWVARGEENILLERHFSLGEMISFLRMEWPEVEMRLQRDAEISGDPSAFRSAIRNTLQNSWLHGQATQVDISVKSVSHNRLQVVFRDNGKGYSGNIESLGQGVLLSGNQSGNGIGLYLTRSLINRMKGQLTFDSSPEGFSTIFEVPGELK